MAGIVGVVAVVVAVLGVVTKPAMVAPTVAAMPP